MTDINKMQLRRRDRAVTDEKQIAELLHRAPYLTIALTDGGRPYIYTISFAFDETKKALYFHGTPHGSLRRLVVENPDVAATVAEMGRLLPSETAMGFSVEFSSVVIYGHCTVITDYESGKDALEMMIAKYFPHLKAGKDYRATTEAEFRATAVYKIDIAEWIGKKKKETDNIPGAFQYPYSGDIQE